MKSMKSKLGLVKVILVGIVIATVLSTSALALNVNVENQVKTISPGEAAKYAVTLENNEAENILVEVSAEADVMTSFSDNEMVLQPGESRTTWLFALAEDKGEGTYMIELKANGQTKSLALNVKEGIPSLKLYNSYDGVEAMQDSSQKIKLIARNTGDKEIENIVVNGDISEKLRPKYPEAFDLDPNEEKEIAVTINVPLDFPKGEYTYNIGIASGSIKSEKEVDVNVMSASPMKNRLSLKVLKSWEKMINDEGEAVGYQVPLRVTNKGLVDLSNVEWEIKGIPEDWEVTGNENFSIEGAEITEKTLEFNTNGNFDTRNIEIKLMKDGREITSEEIEFEGRKVGVTGTGLATAGGSVFLGALFLVAVVLAILLIRERNKGKENFEKKTDQKHLKRLVEETLKREKGSEED